MVLFNLDIYMVIMIDYENLITISQLVIITSYIHAMSKLYLQTGSNSNFTSFANFVFLVKCVMKPKSSTPNFARAKSERRTTLRFKDLAQDIKTYSTVLIYDRTPLPAGMSTKAALYTLLVHCSSLMLL